MRVLLSGCWPYRSHFRDVGRALRAPSTRLQPVAGALCSTPTRIPPEVELLVRLRRGFRERLSIGELAGELGAHRSHLTRQFKRAFGSSPQAFVMLKRCAWTAEQLTRDADTLTAIASAAGFADQSHCIRAFRRAFGTTPSRWGRLARR